jgi:hypothetical protein
LRETGIEHLMLSWTFGGYPSEGLRIVSRFFEECNPDWESTVCDQYKDYAPAVRKAAALFSQAIREFPFCVRGLYRGPQNGGPSNLLFRRPTGMEATMNCFAYDDLDNWRYIYPADVYREQFRKLCEKWNAGLEPLCDLPPCEFTDAAQSGYCMYRSAYNQIRYVMLRDDPERNAGEILGLLNEEVALAVTLYGIMLRDPRVGYEDANQYYFNRTMLLEKIINCRHLIKHYSDMT